MNFTKTLIAAASLSLIGTAASAAVIGFDFEDANNGWSTYESQGYVFDPVNLNSSTRCADDGPNPKHCFLEVTQGDPTELYADTIPDGSESFEDGLITDDTNFDLLGFYINFQGAGNLADNFMRVYDESDVFDEVTETWGGIASSFLEFGLGESYDGTGAITVYLAGDIGSGPYLGELDQQNGYIIVINEGWLEDVTSIFWNASDGANNRVDCVIIGSESGDKSTFDAAQSFSECGPGTTVIPVPAAGFLLLGSLGGLMALRLRRRKS